jgi:hypothetical protein
MGLALARWAIIDRLGLLKSRILLTPFDSVEATNASLLSLLTDQPLPPEARWVRDTPTRAQSLAENYRLTACMRGDSTSIAASARK